MALNSIQKEWEGFAAAVLSEVPVKSTQYKEMKKAFFGGAWAVVTAVEEIGEPHISDEEGMQYFTDRIEECREFTKKLMADHARGN